MQVNTADLIDQVLWLLNRMSRSQVLCVLSFANRLFVSEGQNAELQQHPDRLKEDGREKPHPQRKRI